MKIEENLNVEWIGKAVTAVQSANMSFTLGAKKQPDDTCQQNIVHILLVSK